MIGVIIYNNKIYVIYWKIRSYIVDKKEIKF